MIDVKCSFDEMVKLSELKPHDKNCNNHTTRQIEVLAEIIKNNGMRSPIVVSKLSGKITKGHGRLMALELLGVESAPVDHQEYVDEVAEFQDIVADNEIARHAVFDLAGFDNTLKEMDLNYNEIDLESFGLIDPDITFDSADSDDKDSSEKEKEQRNEIIIKCQNTGELEELVFEFQSKGLNFEVKA